MYTIKRKEKEEEEEEAKKRKRNIIGRNGIGLIHCHNICYIYCNDNNNNINNIHLRKEINRAQMDENEFIGIIIIAIITIIVLLKNWSNLTTICPSTTATTIKQTTIDWHLLEAQNCLLFAKGSGSLLSLPSLNY